jgi:alkyl hydroperoxide reductase subunit AhpF
MAILQAKDQAAVRKEFERINGPVKLVVFSQELVAGELCRQNEQLMKEVAELSDQISVEVLNPQIDRARAEAYGVSDVPLTVVEGARDYGIRFLGIPAGYEFSNLIDAIVATFSNLIDAIVATSRGESSLSDETKATLATLPGEVEIKIFSTPT